MLRPSLGRSILLLGFLVAIAQALPAHAACDPPRCVDVDVPLPAGVTVPTNTVRILLPADYDPIGLRYPVLYLLHGAGDTFMSWTDLTDVQEFSAQFQVIIVMPDCGHDAVAGFYSDWIDGSRQWETFHTRVLTKYIDRHFATLHNWRHRAAAGLSMGGFGAMSYAARHRRLFRAAASFSGAVDSLYPTPITSILYSQQVVNPGIWGSPTTNENIWRAHNPTDLAGHLRGVTLFIASGDGAHGGPAGEDPNGGLGGYITEAFIKAMNLDFAGALDAYGVPYSKDFYQGGYHGWPYWQRELHWALPQIMSLIGPPHQR
ncbi:MAG TPA: alpha/beta hydrolase family protein [Candidatus Kryptonia bacterium]|nr:alpha/beta hydrolase family protein [Candidatus Kryptonia bacterium]